MDLVQGSRSSRRTGFRQLGPQFSGRSGQARKIARAGSDATGFLMFRFIA
ncbi:MAG: hypothetical protein JOY90_13075 [Bradyrhizobium sp.]|nr:hypothetical protein [Bradyrhizobium sp.]MBV9561363.1 hypothetical protein [Bradyrhizobium sp.]